MTPVILTNLIQRFLGLAAFTLLFIQLISGAFMDKLTKKFGGRVFKFHIFEGILIYCLAVLHPLVFKIGGIVICPVPAVVRQLANMV